MTTERDLATFWGRLNHLLDELGWEPGGRAARLSYELARTPPHHHIAESTIASWGKQSTRPGGRQPDYDNAYPVANFLGTTVEALLLGFNETNQVKGAEWFRERAAGEDGGNVAGENG
jgi:hypothetical protein